MADIDDGHDATEAARRDPILVDAAEAARLLSLTESAVARHAAAGDIPCVRLGRLVRFHPPSLDEWAARASASRADFTDTDYARHRLGPPPKLGKGRPRTGGRTPARGPLPIIGR